MLDMLAFCEKYALDYPELVQLNGWLAEMCIVLRDFERAKPFIANMHPALRPIMQGDIALARGDESEAYAVWAKAWEDMRMLFPCGNESSM